MKPVRFDDPDRAAAECLKRLQESEYPLALTGAGVSTDSGVPDFRSKSGLWKKYPASSMSIEYFQENPAEFYKIHQQFLNTLLGSQPNVTHDVLAQLESKQLLRAVITQNIDGLHEKADQETVLNCHGTAYTLSCTQCGQQEHLQDFLNKYSQYQYYCTECGGIMKPDVTLFGESLPEDFLRAAEMAEKADFMMVLGTSLAVYPVAGLVDILLSRGAAIFIINRDPVPVEHKVDYLYYGNLRDFSDSMNEKLQKMFP